jgi:hypothetical protein
MDRWILLSNGADIVDVSPFQFSHVFSDMDRSFREAMPGDISSFQFSHVFSDMDRGVYSGLLHAIDFCSICEHLPFFPQNTSAIFGF